MAMVPANTPGPKMKTSINAQISEFTDLDETITNSATPAQRMRRGVAGCRKGHGNGDNQRNHRANGRDINRVPNRYPKLLHVGELWRDHAAANIQRLGAGILHKEPDGLLRNWYPGIDDDGDANRASQAR